MARPQKIPPRPTSRTRQHPFLKSFIPRLVSTTDRLRRHLTLPPDLSPSYLFINYLVPALQDTVKTGVRFLCAHVLPRVSAAIAALLSSPVSRSQQRETLVIIVPVPPRPPTGRSFVPQVSPDPNGSSSHVSPPDPNGSSPQEYPLASSSPIPTHIIPREVTFGLILLGIQ